MNMELMGTMAEVEWGSLSGMYSTEEADFMAQLLNLSGEGDPEGSCGFWPANESALTLQAPGGVYGDSFYSPDHTDSSVHSVSQETSYSSGGASSAPYLVSGLEAYHLSSIHQNMMANDSSMCLEYSIENPEYTLLPAIGVITDHSVGADEQFLPVEEEPKTQTEEPAPLGDKKNHPSDGCPKKRSRSSRDVVQKNKKNVKSKKSLKLVDNNGEDSNVIQKGNSSSSCCSEDDSIASQELNGGASSSSGLKGSTSPDSSGKTRAGRGSATDPQSLYARKRRERINERLRILQNLVPNGTKVDISTMLEEAVQYVKFLQLQIKLLSSDDLWMYAPLAYNGMNIGLDLNIAAPR